LQIVLLLFSFALVALLTSFIAGNRWPVRPKIWTWWAGGLLAGAVAVLVVFLGSADWWSGRLLAAVTIAGLWFVAPALQSRPHFLRRFAWPFVMLLAVCWNYTALREVYDDAERTWLEAKGSQITEADILNAETSSKLGLNDSSDTGVFGQLVEELRSQNAMLIEQNDLLRETRDIQNESLIKLTDLEEVA